MSDQYSESIQSESAPIESAAEESMASKSLDSAADSVAAPASLKGFSPAEQQELTEILDLYLQKIENSEPTDPDALLQKHPKYATVLRHYLASLGVLHLAAQGIHGSETQLSIPVSLTTDRRLGDYEIRRQIGRGGMGIVYEARQVSLDRRVALKVLPLAAVLDKRQIARFRREAQAAAQLHHPHIVPVFGVGCEQGIHFYSMQLVDGQSLDRVLSSLRNCDPSVGFSGDLIEGLTNGDAVGDSVGAPDSTQSFSAPGENITTIVAQRGSTVEEPAYEDESANSQASISNSGSVCDRRYISRIAELGVQAASALQHAHDYGVIHRDIKPSNLMVDMEGKLWITDFGLAHIQSETDMTATGDLVGTLRYMSPEQASGSEVIDQRTDIYSLGVTLYELLTLRQAIPTKERAQLLRDIEELEPQKMRRINSAIPRDLETIVMKATSKDRNQRYIRAEEFADDLQRFLDGRPTLARRPTLIDLTTKWASRHRGVVASAMLVLLAALVGTSAALFWISAEQARTLGAQEQNIQQRRSAIQKLEKITKLSKRLSKQPQIQREIQLEARELYQQFVAANEGKTPFVELAQTYNRIGGMSEQLGEFQTAEANFRLAANAYHELAQNDAKHLWMEALSLNNLGQALTRLDRVDEARSSYETALAIFESLHNRDTTSEIANGIALVTGNLGHLAANVGDQETAADYLRQAIELREQMRQTEPDDIENQIRLASNYHNLSSQTVMVDLAEAERYCRKAIKLQTDVAAIRADEIEPRTDLALSRNNLGSILLHKRAYHEAVELFELAVAHGDSVVHEAPELPQLRHDLAISCNNLGKALAADGQLDASLAAYEKSGQQFQALMSQQASDSVTLARYGGVLYNQAIVHTKLQRPDFQRASKLFQRAIQVQRQSVQKAPQSKQYASLLRHSLSKYATLLKSLGKDHQLEAIRKELDTLTAMEGQRAN